MSSIITEDSEKESNIVSFKDFKKPDLKFITGGTITGDWLSALPQYTVFLAKAKNDHSYAVGEFHIVYKSEGGLIKLALSKGGAMLDEWVIPARFCNHFNLEEILLHGDDAKVDYENNNRADQQDGLERSADDKE